MAAHIGVINSSVSCLCNRLHIAREPTATQLSAVLEPSQQVKAFDANVSKRIIEESCASKVLNSL
jgi:hypothetical protein